MADRVVRIVEAATRLGMHPKTLQNRCRAGTSPVTCRKYGDGPKAEWVFSDADLTRYVAELFGNAEAASG